MAETVLGYTHKKFDCQRSSKRKRHDDHDVHSMEQSPPYKASNAPSIQSTIEDQPNPKRRQTTALFRPWLTGEKHTKPELRFTANLYGRSSRNVALDHANKSRSYPPIERSELEQRRRDRNTLAGLLNRRMKCREEEQYFVRYWQHVAAMEAAVCAERYLLQLAQMGSAV